MKHRYTCVILDDEPLARKLLSNYIEQTTELKLVGTFKKVDEAISFLESNKVDLLLSDIRMPGLSGIKMVEIHDNLPAIIFTTAYEEYAIKAFELAVIDYLVKPFSIERFKKAIDRFIEFQESNSNKNEELLTIKSGSGFIRIAQHHILYIEANGEYMKIVQSNHRQELVYMRMKDIESILGANFIRIHKSYLVNAKKIDKLAGNQISIGETKLKISRKYKAEATTKINSSTSKP